jgi:Methane oxygenase PmoA
MNAAIGTPVSPSRGELELAVHGHRVAHYVTSPDLAAGLSPRPYLHPVRTLAGVTVTEACPPDHEWHLGVSVAVADVGGSNFWGGPSYHRDRGYEWRDDHGQVQHERWVGRTDTGIAQDLVWVGPGGDVVLHESRSVQTLLARSRAGCWLLAVAFTLRNPTERAVSLGSPGSRGRHNAGYGGFFWRLPTSVPTMSVWSPDHSGEHGVHGRTAAWLAVAGSAPDNRAWSVLLMPGDDVTANDPWFVRNTDYAAVGSALAFDQDLVLQPGATASRTLLAVIADGTLSTPDCSDLHRDVTALWSRRASA